MKERKAMILCYVHRHEIISRSQLKTITPNDPNKKIVASGLLSLLENYLSSTLNLRRFSRTIYAMRGYFCN